MSDVMMFFPILVYFFLSYIALFDSIYLTNIKYLESTGRFRLLSNVFGRIIEFVYQERGFILESDAL